MKYLFSIIFFCSIFSQTTAQNKLNGSVKSAADNSPLIGAIIYIPDFKIGTVTDTAGFFSLSNIPKGTFILEVRYIGFENRVLKINPSVTSFLTILLDENHTHLNEVVITGVATATEKILNPIQTITINKIQLNQISSTNIIDAISQKPGISQLSTGPGISKPVIRGLGFNRILVLNNGIRQEGQQWGDEHGIEIDESSVNKIEIIKGPGSLMYGSDAMGGVIHFLSPNPIEAGKVKSNFGSFFQSNNRLHGVSLQNQGNLNGKYWNLNGTFKQAGNYQNGNDGFVYNSGFSEKNVNGNVGITKKWGFSEIIFSSFNQKVGLITGERDINGKFTKVSDLNDSTSYNETVKTSELRGFEITGPYQLINHINLSSNSNISVGKSRLQLTFGWQQNLRNEFEKHLENDHGHGESENNAALTLKLNTFSFTGILNLPQWKGWENSIGLNSYSQHNSISGLEFLIPEYSLTDAGLFAVTKKTFQNLHFSGGIRLNTRNLSTEKMGLNDQGLPTSIFDSTTILKFDALTNSFSSFLFNGGISYKYGKKSVFKFNIASGFRAPNISELSANGSHEGVFRYEIGSANLNPEKSIQSDLGFLFNDKHFSVEIDLFNNSINDFIYSKKLIAQNGTDSLVVDENGTALPAFRYDQQNAHLFGGEISIDLHPHPFDWLHFLNSFSIVRGVFANQTDSTKNIPFIPAPKFQSEILMNFKTKNERLKKYYVSLSFQQFLNQSKIFSANQTETQTPSYTLLNAGFGAEISNKKGKSICTFTLIANNLFDSTFQNHLSRLKYGPINEVTGNSGVFNMGRNLTLKLNIPISH